VYYNTVLAVVKTINIVNPFDRINVTAVKATVVAGSVAWVVVAGADTVIYNLIAYQEISVSAGDWYNHYNPLPMNGTSACDLQFAILQEAYAFRVWSAWGTDLYTIVYTPVTVSSCLGYGLYLLSITGTLLSLYGLYASIMFEFIFPSTIVLICMIIQMIYIRRGLSGGDGSHANRTVFMVGMLYISCTFAVGISTFVLVGTFYALSGPLVIYQWTAYMDKALGLVMRYSLPLVNSALFPTIIILRKASLRQKYARYAFMLLSLPVRVWRRVQTAGIPGLRGVEPREEGAGEGAGIPAHRGDKWLCHIWASERQLPC
jgi:hypothetical protein